MTLQHEVEVLSARLIHAQDSEQRAHNRYAEHAKLLASGDENADIAGCTDAIERACALVEVISSQLIEARARLDAREGERADAERHEQATQELSVREEELEKSKLTLRALQAEFQALPGRISAEQCKFFELLRSVEIAKQKAEVH